MIVFVTGATGVLGRPLLPLLDSNGHHVVAPSRSELDLFDPESVKRAVRGADAIIHLATAIPPRNQMKNRNRWAMNDRLRAEASRILVDAALVNEVEVYVQPTVTLVYPSGTRIDETTPLVSVPNHLESALRAEEQAMRFSAAGHRGVVLRLGLLYGPGTGASEPIEDATGGDLHVQDAGTGLLFALSAPAGIYNLVADNSRISNDRYKRATGWAPTHSTGGKRK